MARSNVRTIKKDYRALGVDVKDSGAQVVFINPSSKNEGVGKGQLNLGNQQMVAGPGATSTGLTT